MFQKNVLLISLLILIPLIGDYNYKLKCPHENFISKHLILSESAAAGMIASFAERAHKFRIKNCLLPTTVTSVFTAKKMSFRQHDGICTFAEPAIKYNCFWRRSTWSCIYKGSVLASHAVSTGHYFPTLDVYVKKLE